MSGKILIILAVLIILISGVGLFIKNDTQSANEASQSDVIKVTNATVLLAKNPIKKGQAIKEDDVVATEKDALIEYKKEPVIVDKQTEFVVGKLALENIPQGAMLRYDDIGLSQNGVDTGISVQIQGNLPFEFWLESREFNLIKDVKKSSRVDVYFRYEKKNKNKDDGLLNRQDGDGYQNRESANTIDFVLLLKDKRVLDIVEKSAPAPESKGNKTQVPLKGYITLELSPDEIKNIYTLEKLGHFYFFPALDDAGRSFSSKKILAKEFVKELRGGEN